jgi:hypothetical protein
MEKMVTKGTTETQIIISSFSLSYFSPENRTAEEERERLKFNWLVGLKF